MAESESQPDMDGPLLRAFEQRLYQFWPEGVVESIPEALARIEKAWSALRKARPGADLDVLQVLVEPVHQGGYRWSIRVEEVHTREGVIPPGVEECGVDSGWAPHFGLGDDSFQVPSLQGAMDERAAALTNEDIERKLAEGRAASLDS